MPWFSWKVQKPCFWAIFDHFCPIGLFPKNPAVTRNYIRAPNTMLSLRKNYRANSDKTYGQTGRQKDGLTDGPYFIGPFRPRLGVQLIGQFLATFCWFIWMSYYFRYLNYAKYFRHVQRIKNCLCLKPFSVLIYGKFNSN